MFESKNDLSARIKVLDFGLSKKFMPGMSKLMTEGVGTLYTMAPQVLNGKKLLYITCIGCTDTQLSPCTQEFTHQRLTAGAWA